MPIHQLKLIDRKQVADHTIEFIFEKPTSFSFQPGQYGGFTLVNPSETDAGGNTRRFSILSTPADPHLAFTTRIQTSAYKRNLNNLVIGDTIKFAGPTGNFLLPEDSHTPAVLIAGGIGITPFYSMLKHATETQSPRQLTVFYGNQTYHDAAYLSEMQTLEKQNSHIKLISTLAQPDANWPGETGYITDQLIKNHIDDLDAPIYYICGSPGMVKALHDTLIELGINPERIKIEDFPGY